MVSFAISEKSVSNAASIPSACFDYLTQGEPSGQLVLCQSGEIELFGHTGEWTIPADHMVYIPSHRMFRLRARVPAAVQVVQFCSKEVVWRHDGCWVGAVDSFAQEMINYALKWGGERTGADKQARCFFVTLGEMLPGWFRNERIMWTPYAENSAIQKVIDFAHEQGPAITLPEAASHVGMSERTLRRHMKSELGHSWRDFIRELRMNEAMKLLRTRQKSITQTAFEVGFSSSSAFSSAFQDYVGKTPSAYAKSY